MKKVFWITTLIGVLALTAFSGCQGAGAAAAIKQQLDELITSVNEMTAEAAKLNTQIDQISKDMEILKKNHPEFFVEKTEAAATTTTEVKEDKTEKTKTPATTTTDKSKKPRKTN